MKSSLILIGLTMLLSGCVTFPTTESKQVQVVWHESEIEDCQYLETVIGSEGHFYDYWLHANKDMVWGTLNQLRIKTADLGGNTAYLYQPLDFKGSFTMFANAYRCER